MTFEQWWESFVASGKECADDEGLARHAWEAGYTAATHNILENVKRMNDNLFGKEE